MKTKLLALADLADKCPEEIHECIEAAFRVTLPTGIEFLVAYESVGNFGCDSSAYYLFKDRKGKLFEVHGSHCSCNGFEDQWEPKPVTAKYLVSRHFSFNTGGYDDYPDQNKAAVKKHLRELFWRA